MNEENKNKGMQALGEESLESVAGGLFIPPAICPVCSAENYVSVGTTACRCWRCGYIMSVHVTIS